MTDRAIDLVLATLAGFLLAAAYLAARRDRVRYAVTLIVASGAALRLHAALDRFLHSWDERYHALVAKNLISDPLRPLLYANPLLPYDFRDFFSNHVWLHKPPLALWLAAGSMKLFGVNELALRLPSILLSTATILATYAIGARLFTRATGLLAAGLVAVNGQLVELAGGRVASDHVDTLLIALTTIGAFLVVRLGMKPQSFSGAAAVGAVAGLAFLTKAYVALLIPLLFMVARDRNWRRTAGLTLVVLITAAAIALPWTLFVRISYPDEARWESAYALRHLVEALEGHEHPWYWYGARLVRTFGALSLVAIFWFFWRGRRQVPERFGSLISVWIAVPYVVFTMAGTKMPAYVAIAAPAISIAIALFALQLIALRRHAAERSRRIVFAALVTLLLVLPLRYGVERLKPGVVQREQEWATRIKAIAALPQAERLVIVNCRWPIETMFYTPAVAYARDITAAEKQALKRRGYVVAPMDANGSLVRPRPR